MAILKFGTLVVGIRGTVGGLTFTANKSGPVARAWSRGANPHSLLQSQSRNLISSIAASWSGVIPAFRTLWDEFAADPAQELYNAFGDPYYISGMLWYQKINRWRAVAGDIIITTPPTTAKPIPPAITTLVVSAGDVDSKITYPPGTFAGGLRLVIDMTIGISVGAAATPSKPLQLYATNAPGATETIFSAAVPVRFGPIFVGQRAFARVYAQSPAGYRSAAFAIASDVID